MDKLLFAAAAFCVLGMAVALAGRVLDPPRYRITAPPEAPAQTTSENAQVFECGDVEMTPSGGFTANLRRHEPGTRSSVWFFFYPRDVWHNVTFQTGRKYRVTVTEVK